MKENDVAMLPIISTMLTRVHHRLFKTKPGNKGLKVFLIIPTMFIKFPTDNGINFLLSFTFVKFNVKLNLIELNSIKKQNKTTSKRAHNSKLWNKIPVFPVK